MKVEAITDIERVPLAIDYRRMYRGTAMISIGDRTVPGSRIEFALELSALGGHEVSVSFLESADYPIVPAIRILKDHIKLLDRDGGLP